MTKWEYRVIDGGLFNTPEEIEAKYNKLGEEGWEFVSVDWNGSTVIFKRRKDGTVRHVEEAKDLAGEAL